MRDDLPPFIADENIPLEVVFNLQEKGLDIISISQINPGAEDETVLGIAHKEGRILVTFDKDFGELIFRQRRKSYGVILLRIHPQSAENILIRLYKLVSMALAGIQITCHFCVIEQHRIRIIPMFQSPKTSPKNL